MNKKYRDKTIRDMGIDDYHIFVDGIINIRWYNTATMKSGKIELITDDDNFKTRIYSEIMKKQFIKNLFCRLVDNAVLIK
jgi:hypothetical protein